MSETLTPDVTEAKEFVACLKEITNGGGRRYCSNGGVVKESWKDGDYLRKLERRLAKAGESESARQVRLRRNEIDKERAEAVLNGVEATPGERLKLAKRLAENKLFGLARRLLRLKVVELSQSEHSQIYVEYWQKYALYTYKDPDLPLEWRLDEALRILGKPNDLSTTKNRETLGIAGAIHKRKWEVDGQRKHLGRALSFYLRGYAMGLHEEHVAADMGKDKRPAPAVNQSALDAARADVLNYLRHNPECVLQVGKETCGGAEREGDQGYNGINAAFILDLLARLEEDEMGVADADSAANKREGARLIREELTRSVPSLVEEDGGGDAGQPEQAADGAPVRVKADSRWLADEWWFYATVGEAHFGLARYKKAVEWLRTRPEAAGLSIRLGAEPPSGLEVSEWEYETTARQLARLARLGYDSVMTEAGFKQTPAGVALNEILCGNEKAVGSAFRGKFGLGLSGGGFRASLFHIGVLARLAELDVLRHVEVLSCVSGGSIVGAHYYLEVRRLLETTPDDGIRPEDYVRIVERIERDFLAGVQRNIRTRVLAGWLTNVKMIFWPGYSRTRRVGELYERELYSRVADGVKFEGSRRLPGWAARLLGKARQPRWLNELYIRPVRGDGTRQDDFKPRSHNWRRNNKAPDLILNAATLNTGHNWQFTASFMGEPPTPINRDIDCNYRLRRMYYRNAPEDHRRIRLGHAVAASSCVPGLFEPLILDGLYPYADEEGRKGERPVSVRLVDGGVCDNQGIMGLLEQDCTVMLVSDGSGQMDAQDEPSSGVFGTPLRSNSILQARVRESQYSNVNTRRRASLLRGLMFVHLRQDLPGENKAWRDCPSEFLESDFERREQGKTDATSYGIASRVQRKLSAIRTDLDSFNDAEAYALMASGYRMTTAHFEGKNRVEGFPAPVTTGKWSFLAPELEEAMKHDSEGKNKKRRKRLEKILDAGASLAFKSWKLSPTLVVLKWALAVVAIIGLGLLFYDLWNASVIPPALYKWVSGWLTFKWVAVTVLTIIAVRLAVSFLDHHLGKNRGQYVVRALRPRETLNYVAIGLVMSTLGCLLAWLHLRLFDPPYLRYGRINKFPN